MVPNENDLLTSIKSDSPTAFKALFDLYHSGLCRLAFGFVRDRDAAKDIVQDVFIKFWHNRKSIEITSSLSAYLKRSVINTALNYLEKIRRHPTLEVELVKNHPIGPSSDQTHAFNELSIQLDEAINRLPVRTRAVFILIRKEEMSYKEVGVSLNISTKAVEKEMMKALRLLREMLKNFLPAILIASTII